MTDVNVADLPLEIEQTIEDIVIEENGDATFECRVTGYPPAKSEWYRNGEFISDDETTTISIDGCWHRLELTCISAKHYGLYTVLCKNEYSQVTSQAVLHVTPKQKQKTAYTYTNSKTALVTKHLIGNYLIPGDRLSLEVAFQSDIKDIKWFKNDQLIKQNERLKVNSNKRSSNLFIDSTNINDSGFYLVVANTKCGLTSSFAKVQVMETNDELKSNDLELPYIEVVLPEELEATAGDDIRLFCKARIKETTDVVWSKKGVKVINNERIFVEFLVNDYICFRIVGAEKTDSGEYTVSLKDENGDEVDSSTCFITVNASIIADLPVVHVWRPLEDAVALAGDRVIFDCRFCLLDQHYFFTTWRVANVLVLRSNTEFTVVTNGGDSLLYIHRLEPWMSGRITCELRKATGANDSLLINSTWSRLNVVTDRAYMTTWAREVSASSRIGETTMMRQRIHPEIFGTDFSESITEIHTDPRISATTCDEYSIGQLLMEVYYCRFENSTFFLRAWNWRNKVPGLISVSYVTPMDSALLAIIQWKMQKSTDYWYTLEMADETGRFVHLGVSSSPVLEVANPGVNQIMQFRVRLASADDTNNISTRLTVTPSPANSEPPQNKFILQPVAEFHKEFGTPTNLLGSGAFGSVYMVQDKNGERYAAKMIKTRSLKKINMAMREYNNMTQLHHPKLIRLHRGYNSRDMVIIVMEFLWGGELFQRMVNEDQLKEADVVPYVRQICEGLRYLHEKNMVHLDLKPENIVCLSPNSTQIKLIDFGLARVITNTEPPNTIYGTKHYIAPELLNFDNMTVQSDMWSLGVVTFVLLSGVLPFTAAIWPEESARITSGDFNFREPAFRDVSSVAKLFIKTLLKVQPSQRMTAEQALAQEWLVQGPPANNRLMKQTKTNLKTFLENRARWQKAGNVVIAAHRLRKQANRAIT